MKLTKMTMMAAGLALSLNAFAGSSGDMARSMSFNNSADAIQAAKEAWAKARSVSGEWRDTVKMIKQAEKLASEGKESEAIELANMARIQGINGYNQAVSQQGKPASL